MSYQALVKIKAHRHYCSPCRKDFTCGRYHNHHTPWGRCEAHR
jgi:hypothetical protein